MFCVMDVSGSMDEQRKDLAKRFFILLYLFLTRNYEKIEVVFIRHHTRADEVDEDTFFHSTESGGTVSVRNAGADGSDHHAALRSGRLGAIYATKLLTATVGRRLTAMPRLDRAAYLLPHARVILTCIQRCSGEPESCGWVSNRRWRKALVNSP